MDTRYIFLGNSIVNYHFENQLTTFNQSHWIAVIYQASVLFQ